MWRNKKTISVMALLMLVLQLFAQGPNNSGTYYQAANGRKGAALKTALYTIISKHTTISYDGLLTYYKQTDRRADGKVWDMYSNTTNYSFTDNNGSYKKEGDIYNREHSVPQSWFGKASPMKSDIVHVVPTDGYVNGRRSNFPFGETKNPTYTSNNGFSKLGPCSVEGYSGTVFEPNDEYKGDFARIYFYMATCYENKIASWNQAAVFAGNAYPAYKAWFIKMLLRWAKEDPVSQKEIDRNNAVYGCQHNRNPYVDYPGLEQYVWGDKQDVAFSYDHYDSANPNPDPNPDPDPDPNPDPDPDPDPDPADGVTFVKVATQSDVAPGNYYLLVFGGNVKVDACALSDLTGGKNYYTSATVTIGADGRITTDVDTKDKPHQLLLGGTAGAYTLYDGTEKAYLTLTGNENKLYTTTQANSAQAQWTITVSGGATHIYNKSFTTREIQFNASNPRFACYTGSQQPVMLYRRAVTNGIDAPTSDAATKVSVYSLTGVMVRHQVDAATALDGLPKGVYILNGRKMVVQ